MKKLHFNVYVPDIGQVPGESEQALVTALEDIEGAEVIYVEGFDDENDTW